MILKQTLKRKSVKQSKIVILKKVGDKLRSLSLSILKKLPLPVKIRF